MLRHAHFYMKGRELTFAARARPSCNVGKKGTFAIHSSRFSGSQLQLEKQLKQDELKGIYVVQVRRWVACHI